jgi:hypothetical protein
MIDKVSTTDAKDDNSDAGAAGQVPMLFRPFSLRGVTFGNRIVVTPMCQYSADDGYAANWHFAHHGRFSLAGVGAAVIEATGVTRDGRITPGCLGIYEDGHIEGLSRITAIYHEQRIPVGIQLAHAGRKASAAVPLQGAAPLVDCDPSNAWQAVAPSAIALADSWPVPRALAESDINHRSIRQSRRTRGRVRFRLCRDSRCTWVPDPQLSCAAVEQAAGSLGRRQPRKPHALCAADCRKNPRYPA